jgi:myxalamid-type polyketide synthase MxaE and MxaD
MGESLSPTKRALLALQHMRARLDAVEAAQSQPIAIIGMACRFPGAADLQAYWRLLESGADAISEVPPNRWDVGSLGAAGRWGGFLEGLDAFDAEFFGISAREAPHVDPRQRLMLEVAWEALEDAGVPPPSLAGSATGVFVATLSNDYDSLMSRNYRLFESFTGAGTANAIVANRVSYFLDVTGPSIAIDTACSGSLVALDLACRSLRRDESSLALAGGVSVNLLPGGDVFFAAAGALSPTGRCHVFDRDADGIVRSEGAGLVVLKRLDRAIADGDRVYAVIRGSAVNHDGRSNGIMAPNGLAQEAVLREAYRQAGVSPGAVQYAEAHGTGTALGDAIEVRALAAVLADGRPAGRACMLGSVKSNLGHMEAAAGIAGVIKTALALAHRRIPATLHIANRSALLEEAGFPLYLPTRLECWPYPDEKLIAGVSSFGFGGSNAHVVLEEAPATATRPTGGRSMYLLTVSAASTEALRELQLRYREHLQANPDDVADVCYTAAVRRSHHGIRTAVAGTSADEICAQLGVQAGSMLVGGPIAFAFSGQGTQWLGMGLSLLECEPAARAVLEECDALLRERWRWSLIDLLRAPAAESRLRENSVAQAVIFAVQVAQAALWRTWGVQPDVVFGQSLGEIAAAHCAGALTLSDAIEVVYRRSLLMDTLVGRGRTAVVGLGPAQTELAIGAFAGAVTLAGHTGPNTSLVSGDTEAVARLVEDLSAREIFCRQIEDVEIAFHGPQMAPISLELERALSGLVPGAVKLRFLSTVTGGELAETRLDGGYWARNLRDPFRVGDAIRQAIAVGCRTFVEIAPHAVLGGAIRGWMEQEGVAGLVLASGRRDVP